MLAALVALSGCEGGFPTSDLYNDLAKAKAETACEARPDSNDTQARMGAETLILSGPALSFTVSSFVTEKETHDEDKLGSTDSLNANIKAGAENPPRIGGSGLVRTLSVFGNSDGEIGNLFADGSTYRKDSVAFASNEFALGSMVTVTTPEGRSLTAPVRDRMARRFAHSRIDATVSAWKQLTSRGYGLIRGVRVRRAK